MKSSTIKKKYLIPMLEIIWDAKDTCKAMQKLKIQVHEKDWMLIYKL